MGSKVSGERKLMRELENRFGKKKSEAIHDRALLAGADVFVEELKKQMEPWADTHASIDEITVGEPRWEAGVRVVPIHWKGPKNRYRIIHLNEFGTVKNPNPAGKGAIARAMRNAEKSYRAAVRKELAKAYG